MMAEPLFWIYIAFACSIFTFSGLFWKRRTIPPIRNRTCFHAQKTSSHLPNQLIISLFNIRIICLLDIAPKKRTPKTVSDKNEHVVVLQSSLLSHGLVWDPSWISSLCSFSSIILQFFVMKQQIGLIGFVLMTNAASFFMETMRFLEFFGKLQKCCCFFWHERYTLYTRCSFISHTHTHITSLSFFL